MREVAKNLGVSSQTIYGWREHLGSLEPPDIVALARTSGAAWLRVLQTRHAVVVRRAEHALRRGARADRAPAHQHSLRSSSAYRDASAEGRAIHVIADKSLDPQDTSGAHLSARAFQPADAFQTTYLSSA